MTRFYAAITLATLMVLSSLALAHGEHGQWIQDEPSYKERGGNTHCCSPVHCGLMPADVRAELQAIPNGWRLRGEEFYYNRPGLYPVAPHAPRPDQWHWCWIGGKPFCLFEPGGMS